MTDIESGPPVPVEPVSSCKLGSLTLVFLIFSVVIFCVQLSPLLAFVPAQTTWLSLLLLTWFPFAVDISGLLVNLVILLFFSTFFEKKLGSLGFFLKLEFFKLLFGLLTLAIYHFLFFVHPSSVISKALTLGDFAMLFMIFVSQEAFERPNDFSILPVLNLSFKNVSPFAPVTPGLPPPPLCAL